MPAYYNEIEPFAAEWLRNLISAGHIASGDVDTRSIVDVRPDDLKGYEQCHFFAGIGGWSHALRLADWDDTRLAWTGSCPCQPISVAGEGKAHEDDRHLWPAFFRLICERRPAVVFGEQVASGHGRAWLDGVLADLEGAGYATAAANLPACGVGAPHFRARLWFVADAHGIGREEPRERREDTSNRSPFSFGQADRVLDAVRSNALPFLCREHDGISASVGAMRAYGNAIVPQVAEAFIRAYDMRRVA